MLNESPVISNDSNTVTLQDAVVSVEDHNEHEREPSTRQFWNDFGDESAEYLI